MRGSSASEAYWAPSEDSKGDVTGQRLKRIVDISGEERKARRMFLIYSLHRSTKVWVP